MTTAREAAAAEAEREAVREAIGDVHATVALLQESIAAALPPLATYFDAAAIERVGPWPPPQLHELLAAVDGAAFVAHRAPLGALYRSVCAEHDDLYARQLRALRTLLPQDLGIDRLALRPVPHTATYLPRTTAHEYLENGVTGSSLATGSTTASGAYPPYAANASLPYGWSPMPPVSPLAHKPAGRLASPAASPKLLSAEELAALNN